MALLRNEKTPSFTTSMNRSYFSSTIDNFISTQEHQRKYLLNAYRVLLTRARQGLIIFVPEGDIQDKTRDPKFYDGTYEYLINCGFDEL
tara:strand:- start:2474 stop:2740 length:267 start_codon:yes stop_codon:yes gene_type:complete